MGSEKEDDAIDKLIAHAILQIDPHGIDEHKRRRKQEQNQGDQNHDPYLHTRKEEIVSTGENYDCHICKRIKEVVFIFWHPYLAI